MFVSLHNHTYYSVLDGHSSPEEYLKRAAEIGLPAISITDHGSINGHREFQRAARAVGIKPILGMEAYYTIDMTDRREKKLRDPGDYVYNHLTILAKNETGLKTLGRLSQKAYNDGFYKKPRIGKDLLFNDHEGLIILSGCMSGVIPKAIERNEPEEALGHALEWESVFGDDFYIEVMSSNEAELNHALLDIADKAGIKPVMTQDSHYATKEDLWVGEAMLILSTSPKAASGTSFEESQKMDMVDRFNYLYPDRHLKFSDIELYVRDQATEEEKFAAQEITRTDIFEHTLEIADKVQEYPYYEGLDLLPRINSDAEKAFSDGVAQGLIERGLESSTEALKRVSEETQVICSMGYAPYFLIVEDAVREAKSRGIRMSPGRGSVCASLCAYAMGIHEINPLTYGLLFDRFLNPDRNDPPDIDLDFQASRRSEEKEYIRGKYPHVASISTYGYFKDKGIIRDAARVFRVPLGDVNRTLKNISTFEEFETSDKAKEFRTKYPEVLKLATQLRGRIRSQGVHAGGLVLSSKPISDYAPMQTGVDPNNKLGPRIPVVGLDMHEVADIGFTKFDFLGINSLDIVDSCIKMIKERTGDEIDLNNIPLDDSDVYKSLSDGLTKGLFQVEASASTKLIMKMGVNNFDELAASNALVRPGAADSSFGKNYLKGKKTGNFKYIHPDTEWFTEETYGQIIYQEQILQLCVELAGMTMAQANELRLAVGKKIHEKLALWKDIFTEGATKKIGPLKAERLWKDLEASGNYSFNKSHAVAYSMLTYQMSYLKQHYPLEFMVAALKHRDDKDDRLDLLMEAKRMGLRIVLPHVNESDYSFSIQTDERGDYIRMGLTDIKYVGHAIAAKLIAARPFNSYEELVVLSGEKYSGINKRTLEYMNKVGAAVFEDNPLRGDERENYYECLSIPAFNVKALSPKAQQMTTPLEEYDDSAVFVTMGMVRGIKRGPGWARIDVVDETGKAGIFIEENTLIEAGNMYVLLVSNNRVIRYMTPDDLSGPLEDYLEGRIETPEGYLTPISFKPRKTKAGNNMGNVVFIDENDDLRSAIVFDSNFFDVYSKLKPGVPVQIEFGQTKDGADVIRRVRD